ncbi:tetratricopeptide repeat protein [Streptomyces yaizuensis]|nr:tetratricopeptide repeat protein [Streptomyces sp. YSPA8]
MAGVGKSLLACHAARRLAPYFPDGQLHLHLRAHLPGLRPLTAREALTSLLRDLGVPPTDIPDDLAALTGRWRTLIGSRRAVIVLDDAVDAQQLEPLLPGASPSLVIVTSRRRITGIPGLVPVRLGVLPPQDAIALFRGLAGEERTRHTGEVLDLVRLSGYLPLAIELAASRLASRPSWTTGHLLSRITRSASRLGEFRDGDRAVAVTFDVSYRTLPEAEQELFRLLGLRFGADCDAYAAAALAGVGVDRAERALEHLLDAHLLQEPAPDRFTLHDLLAEYARELVAADPAPVRERAVRRLVDFYVQASHAADRTVFPRRLRPGLTRPPSAVPVPDWDGPSAARRWYAAERAGLVAAERHCREHGRDREAALLADSLAGFLIEEGAATEAQEMHRAAARHWQAAGDPRARTHSLVELATALSSRAGYEDALRIHEQALSGARELGDTAVGTEVVHRIGVVLWHLGRLPEALERQREVLALRLRAGDPVQVARCRNNLGITHLYLGDFEDAQEYFDAALAAFGAAGETHESARVLNNLSELNERTGNLAAARDFLHRAVDLFVESGSGSELAIARVNLAGTMTSPAELHTMVDLYQESLGTFRRLGDQRNVSITLQKMGCAMHAAGEYRVASHHHLRALDVARGIGAAHEEMQALYGLGLAEAGLGRTGAAVVHLTAAVEAAERAGAAREAARARAALSGLTARAGDAADAAGAADRPRECPA